LWTPAEAEPNSAPAAMIELPFILLFVCGVEICVGGGEKSEEECGGWMERWLLDETVPSLVGPRRWWLRQCGVLVMIRHASWKVLFVRQPLSSDGHHRTMLPLPAACQYLQLQY
jgi:hypothetical protein